MNKRKIALLLLLAVLIAAFYLLDAQQYLNLAFFKQRQAAIDAYYQRHLWQTVILYFLIYVAIAGLSLPGAAILTLAGGALFGLIGGTVIVSFASTLGATIAFLSARFILRDAVQQRFAGKLSAINKGFERDGAFYLFSLRLVPVFPFFMINLLMGLTPLRTRSFFVISQIGMLPGTLVYVNAGTQIAQIEQLSGILSPQLLISFILLGLFPLIARKILAWITLRFARGASPHD